MKKYIKKSVLFFIMLMVVITGCSDNEVIEPAKEEIDSSIVIGNMADRNNTDVVLVMDKSGSMAKADPNRLAVEGAKLFIDMEKISGVSVALVEFSNEVEPTGLIGMQQKNKEHLKSVLDAIVYIGKAHTDMGAGMLEAVSILDQSDSDNDKAIILFTDGRTDIDAGTPGRTTEDSLNDTNTAVQMAVEKGYTIYCIGLNYDNSVDEAELQRMALATGGKYHIAASVDELREFFNAIFTDIDDTKEEIIADYTADGNYRDFAFTISNGNVAEANIVILSSRRTEDIVLIDTNGTAVDLDNDEDVIFSDSETYSLIKLVNPAVGEWKISVKGIADDQIKIGMIYNFNFSLMVEIDRASVVKDRDVNVKAYLTSEGERFIDSNFYRAMEATLVVSGSKAGQIEREALIFNEEECVFEGSFAPAEPAEYEAYVHIEGNGLFRDSDSFTIVSTKTPVILLKDFEEQKVRVGQTKRIDLGEYFQDADGDPIYYSVEAEGELTDIVLQDAALAITGKNAGITSINVYVDNGSADVGAYKITVQCLTFFDEFKFVLIPLIILSILILLVCITRKGKERIDGVFKVSFVVGEKDENGTVQMQTFDILNSISAAAFGNKSFTVEKFLKSVQEIYVNTEYDKKRKDAFTLCVSEMLAESKKVKICGSRKAFEIRIINRSSKVKFYYMGTLSDRKRLTISLADERLGIINATENKFGIQFIYNQDKYGQININYQKL